MTEMWSCQTRVKLQRLRIRSRTSSCSVLSYAHSPRTSVRLVFSDAESDQLHQPAELPDISYKPTSTSALQFGVRTRHGRASDAKEKISRTPDRTEKRCRPPRKVADTSRFRASAARPPRLNVAREPPAADDRRPTTVPTNWLCRSALVTRPTPTHTTLHSQWPKHTFRALRDRRRLTWFQPWAPAFRRATRLSPPA